MIKLEEGAMALEQARRPIVILCNVGFERVSDGDVVEYAIQNNSHASLACHAYEVVKIFIRAEPRIESKMVKSVVTMRDRGEDWAEEQVVGDAGGVIKPRLKAPETMLVRAGLGPISDRGACGP